MISKRQKQSSTQQLGQQSVRVHMHTIYKVPWLERLCLFSSVIICLTTTPLRIGSWYRTPAHVVFHIFDTTVVLIVR